MYTYIYPSSVWQYIRTAPVRMKKRNLLRKKIDVSIDFSSNAYILPRHIPTHTIPASIDGVVVYYVCRGGRGVQGPGKEGISLHCATSTLHMLLPCRPPARRCGRWCSSLRNTYVMVYTIVH